MCGIVGFYSDNNSIDESVLKSMRDALSHRGPDDAGLYIEKEHNVGLAHRRLSILDLSSQGHQPMSNDDGSIWITYNGEVYNFKEIREELEKKSYAFKSNSDTEVLVKAYEEWGIDCVHKFIGMFALAIWDRNEQKLYLVR
ncbi:asparagine synthetase B, partial [Desulfobacterota bacterium AH_259_B03_O07]|nr:asparagine synthetase B [Desulfobacterota bacterium AH_259_B03_O07]